MDRIDELEGLRGFLAVWVVFVHLLPAAGIEPHVFGLFAPLFGELIRVQIFCIMSGFVLFLMLAKSRHGYLTYLRRRFARLYPVYILAFFGSVAFAGVAYDALITADFQSARNTGRIGLLEDAFERWPQHVAAHVSLLHGVIPDSLLPSGAYTFLGQAWNISTEFQFYVIVPAIFWCLSHRRVAVRLGCLASIALVWWITRRWPNGAALPHYAVYFLGGIGSYYLWKLNWANVRIFNRITVLLAAIVLVYFNIAAGIWFYIFGYAVLVRDKGAKTGNVARFLKHPAMLWLGAVSYSLYLLHMIPLYGWMGVLNRFELTQLVYFGLLSVLTLGSAIPLAFLAYRYVETRFYQSKTHRIAGGVKQQDAVFSGADAVEVSSAIAEQKA